MSTHLNYFKMSYMKKMLTQRNLTVERADHTIKIHRLIQGVFSWFRLAVNTERIFRLDSVATEERLFHNEITKTVKSSLSLQNSLSGYP